jgi:hypothetical protein
MNINKATGKVGISVKMLKIAKPIVSKPITMLINKTIENASLPNKLKEAQVVSLHKKKRLVTIDLSVYYQWCRSSSRQPYLDNFHNILKIYFILFYLHLDTAPLKIFEDWKKTIDFNQYTAAVLVDLSKAFDCLKIFIKVCHKVRYLALYCLKYLLMTFVIL